LPGPSSPASRGSPYLPQPRGPSSHTQLRIDWDHPVYGERAAAIEGRTASIQGRTALPADQALAFIAGDDPRPLLVLRECLHCSGTEDALLARQEDNERTFLLSRWFHCVKLPPDVLEDEHPLRQLFPGEKPAHLFLSNRDGSERHDLDGAQSRRELWAAMDRTLAANYEPGFEQALRELYEILDDLDEVDRSLEELERRYELAIAKDGADSPQVKKLHAQLTEKRGKRSDLLARAQRASQLELVPRAVPAGVR
jgi:exonuclease VII small subunit